MTPFLKRLDDLKAVRAKATRGPWTYLEGEEELAGWSICMLADGHAPCGVFPVDPELVVPLDVIPENGTFISEAANSWGALVGACRVMREALEHSKNGCLVPPDGGSPDAEDHIANARDALAKADAILLGTGGGEEHS